MKSLEKRFEEKVERVTESGCWIWTAGLNPMGYGRINTCSPRGVQLAHRVSFELYEGEIPRGLLVCHLCDVRSCVNPDHLFLGTHADNSRDMAKKKRSTHGKKNPSAKLTESQIKDIRANLHKTNKELASEYGVHKNTIYYIRYSKTWRNLK